MKKLVTFTLLLFGLSMAIYSQGFNYQTVLRSSSGVEKNTSVVVKFTIKQGSDVGTSVYSESHSVTTNEYGIISVVVGEGTVLSGIFADIDWSNGPYFMGVEIDGEDMGTSQLNSLPFANYALEAKNAEVAQVAEKINFAGAAEGDLLYFNGTDWVLLPKGSDDQVLTLESGLPLWKDVATNEVAEPKLGEAYSGGIIVAIYADGDVLVAYNTVITNDEALPTMDYMTAESKVAAIGADWRLPTAQEMLKLSSNSIYFSALVIDMGLKYWTSTEATASNDKYVFTDLNLLNYESGVGSTYANRVIAVKKVPYL